MLDIDDERFRRSFDAYSAIGATDDGGLHRLALSDADREARDRFVEDLEALGLDVRVDRVGNVFGRRPGTDPDAAPVLVGSHLDSQPSGGRYDGQLGVLAALEALRTFDDEGVETERPVEVVDWTNEEGSRFHHAMLGSAVAAGETALEAALDLTDADGARLGDELARVGYDGDAPVGDLAPDAYLELHVEQGPRLAEGHTSVGVVEGVVGIAWLRVTIAGTADHAGPTPMHAREDAMAAAADAVADINRLPIRLAADARATVGEFAVAPDSVNVVPDRATFTVDLRAADGDVVERAVDRAEAAVAAACDRHGTTYELERVWDAAPTEFAPRVADAVADAAAGLEVPHERLVSGAGHDATYVNRVAPAGMAFVPSVGGRTHAEEEFTEWADCVRGAAVVANATLSLAGVVAAD